jgi:hypothetical protein
MQSGKEKKQQETLIYKKQVFKRWKGKVECLYDGLLEANVYFAKDL